MSRRCIKHRLPTENVAYQVAKSMAAQGKFVQPYLCDECKRWHVGTSAGLRRKRLDYLFDKIAAERASSDGAIGPRGDA